MVQPPSTDSVLNNKRPKNPFTPSPEPDWVTVSRPSSHQGPGLDGTSESRAPSMRQVSNQTQATNDRIHSRASSGVVSPPSRVAQHSNSPSVASVTSSTSSIIRKPAPPVPKKPALLSRPSDRSTGTERHPTNSLNAALSPAIASSRPQSLAEANPIYPPPPRRTTGMSTKGTNVTVPLRQANGNQQRNTNEEGPPLPRREKNKPTRKAVDLMDEDDGGAQSIPALQPQRKI